MLGARAYMSMLAAYHIGNPVIVWVVCYNYDEKWIKGDTGNEPIDETGAKKGRGTEGNHNAGQ